MAKILQSEQDRFKEIFKKEKGKAYVAPDVYIPPTHADIELAEFAEKKRVVGLFQPKADEPKKRKRRVNKVPAKTRKTSVKKT